MCHIIILMSHHHIPTCNTCTRHHTHMSHHHTHMSHHHIPTCNTCTRNTRIALAGARDWNIYEQMHTHEPACTCHIINIYMTFIIRHVTSSYHTHEPACMTCHIIIDIIIRHVTLYVLLIVPRTHARAYTHIHTYVHTPTHLRERIFNLYTLC